MIYILDGHTPVKLDDDRALEWAQWFETHRAECVVGQEIVKEGGLEVSTCFLGVDHNHARIFHPEREHKPLLFETCLFKVSGVGRHGSDVTQRYSTWEEALVGHRVALEFVRRAARS